MKRRNFIKGILATTGTLFLGSSLIYNLTGNKEKQTNALPSRIDSPLYFWT